MTIFSDRLNLEVMCSLIDEIIKELKSAEKGIKDDTQKNAAQRTKRGLELLKDMLAGTNPELITMMTVSGLNTSLQQLKGEVESFKQGRDAIALANRGDSVFHHFPQLTPLAQADSPENRYQELFREFRETVKAELDELQATAKTQESNLSDLNNRVTSVGSDVESLGKTAESRIQAVQSSLETLETDRVSLSERLESTQVQLAAVERACAEFLDKTRQEAEERQAQRATEFEKSLTGQEQRYSDLLGRTETSITEKVNEWSTAFSESENKRQAEFTEVQNALSTEFSRLTDEFASTVSEKVREWDQKLQDGHAAHEKSFTDDIQNRAERLKAQESRWNDKLAEQLAKAKAESDEGRKADFEEATRHIESMTQMEEQARKLVGLIGNTGVTGNYQKIADRELRSANWMRGFAIGALGALVVVVFLLVWMIGTTEVNWEVMIFRMLVAIPLLGLAVYCGKESSRHRTNEERNRRIELELAALSPYLHQLRDEKAQEIRETLTEKYFGNESGVQEDKNPHLDVSLRTLLKHLEPVVELAKKLK